MLASAAAHTASRGCPSPATPGGARRPSGRPCLSVRSVQRPSAGAASSGAGLPAGLQGAGAGGSSSSSAVELKGGALWWQHLHRSTGVTEVVGTNFVLQRPSVGGPGLVKLVRQPKPVVRPAPPPAAPPAVWHGPVGGTELALAGSPLGGCSVVIDTEFVVLPQPAQPAPGQVAPNTTCVGIVWQASVEEEGREGSAARHRGSRRRSSKHPRRTQMLRFTCNLCGEVNDCEVNPHAWGHGSVFARCEGCTAVHKLKDNLRIFHELAGPVFPPRELRSTYLVQEILDKIQENNRS